jgi:NAD-dependent SIR2 family protein deacetylase
MKFLTLIITFSITLIASNECNSCHKQESKTMTTSCTSCHTKTYKHQKDPKQKTSPVTLENYKTFYNDDKPIVRNFQGLMQKDYGSTELLHMQGDIHFQKGMLCQDCHSLEELHNDGFWSSQLRSSVKCQDCHGTVQAYPWELPEKEQRTPLKNLDRDQEMVLVKLASGKVLKLKPLKLLKKAGLLSQNCLIAMENITGHLEKLECSSCHSTWAPQFFGSKVVKEKKNHKSAKFVRWEEPFLSQNLNAKIAPAVPKTPLSIFQKEKNGTVTQTSQENILQTYEPHTTQKTARDCESCHSSSKVIDGVVDEGIYKDENITHFNISKTLSNVQRDKLDRRGVCLSCHDTIPNGSLSISMVSHVSQMIDNGVDEKEHKAILNKMLYMSAWFEIILVTFGIGVLIYILYTIVIKRKSINPRNKGWK